MTTDCHSVLSAVLRAVLSAVLSASSSASLIRHAMCDACCLKWPMRSMPALFTVGDGGIAIGEKHVRVCYSCDGAAQAFR